MEKSIIEIKDLWFSFNGLPVLEAVNLAVSEKGFVALIGPNGGGKTTLLKLMLGLLEPERGDIRIFGKSPRQSARRIGYVPQEIGINKSFPISVMDVVLMGRLKPGRGLSGYSQNDKTAAQKILEQLEMWEFRSHRIGELSGGQRQRVAIARALANKPKLVLADEPTAALDKDSGRIVVNLLKKLTHEAKSTVVIVTHDNRILDVADRIINMVDGHIVSDVVVNESIMICEFLSKCSIFESLSTQNISETAQGMVKESYPKETVLFKQGDMGDKFFLIRKGVVEIIKDDTLIRTQEKGDFFGEMALLTGEPRSATVVAKEDLTLYSLTKDKFTNVIGKSDSFKNQLLNVFFQRT